jgi:UDP-3-O-[3-hydroxymyristoyl] glucosamine N-acyltransferase
VIRRGAKIDNLVQIAHNNDIGQHVIITGLGGLCGSVTVGDYSVLGGRTTVTDHVTLGPGTQAGLCSVITKSTAPRQTVWGMPAQAAHDAKRELAATRRLPALLKSFADVLVRLARLEREADAHTHCRDRSAS